MTDAAKAKLSASRIGKPLSVEHRRKLSDAQRSSSKAAEHRRELASRPRTAAQLAAAIKTGKRIGRVVRPYTSARRAQLSASIKATYASGSRRVSISKAIATAADLKRGRPMPESQRLNIATRQTGRPLSESHRAAIRAGHLRYWMTHTRSLTPEQKDAVSRGGKRAWAQLTDEEKYQRTRAAQLWKGPSSIERAVAALLDSLGVQYASQHRIGRYTADIYVPSQGLVIECDGEYWHGKPLVRERDRARDEYMIAMGLRVLRLPEREIRAGRSGAVIRSALRAAACS